MNRSLHVFQDAAADGPTNMARDEHLLYAESPRPAALRIYAWDRPTISLGYFQRFDDVARLPADVRGLAVVRRMTGGGAILHDREVTYGLVLDDTLPIATQSPVALYELVHECWRVALTGSGAAAETAPAHLPLPTPRSGPFFCFEKPGRTDLIIDGRKLLGSAQRRIRGRVLQHGSLLLGHRFESHPGADLGEPPTDAVAAWSGAFVDGLATRLELDRVGVSWSAEQLVDVARRRARYAGQEWTRQR